jgi:F-type H+-transporting ATPase subunit epsilon
MADQFQFELVAPEKLLFSAPVDMVVVPGIDGNFAVLPGHAPILSSMRPGSLEITTGGETQRIFVRGGFAEATPESLTVLAEFALPLDELDVDVLNQQIKDMQEDFEDARDDETRRRAKEKLDHLEQIKAAL